MHIEGDAQGQLEFSAWEQRVRELAWIVDAGALEQELATALRFAPHVSMVEQQVSAELLAVCEGKASATREALGAGGVSNGEPGLRSQYAENYYAAFILDPDGNNIEAVCRQVPA